MTHKYRVFAAITALLLLICTLPAGTADPLNEVTVDFADEKNVMDPKTGFLLTPSYNIPDSRIESLGVDFVRDDISIQNLTIKNYSTNGMQAATNDGNPSIAKLLSGARRLKDLGSPLYAILFTPTWMSTSPVADHDSWAQWIRDIAFLNREYDLGIRYWDTWNEFWWITRSDFNEMYKTMWNVVKNTCPDGMTVAPSGYTGYKGGDYKPEEDLDIISDATAFMDFCRKNGLTLDVLSWHFSENNFDTILNTFREYAAAHPEIGIQEYCLEEYQVDGKNLNPGNLVVDCIRRFENGDIDMAYKGVWNSIDGMSDLLSIRLETENRPGSAGSTPVENADRENPAVRRPSWWVMRAYASMSGTRAGVESNLPDVLNGIASADHEKQEACTLLGADLAEDEEMTATIRLENLPFSGQQQTISVFHLTDCEDDGWEKTDELNTSDAVFTMEMTFRGNDVYFIRVQGEESVPGDFYPVSPDDGMAAGKEITLTWSVSDRADAYRIAVSREPDMCEPFLTADGIGTTSYVLDEELEPGTYYWSVTAANPYGETAPLNGVVYSVYVAGSADVPGRFGLYYPYNGMSGAARKSLFAWAPAYNADSYRLVVAEDPDFTNIVTEETGTNTLHYLSVALNPDTTYYWKILALNDAGERPNIGQVFTFHTGTDSKPGAFVIREPKDGDSPRMTLTWEESAGAMFYQLTVAEDEAFTDVVLRKNKISVNGFIFLPGELTPGKTYYVKVTAANDKGRTQAGNNGLSFTLAPNPTAPLLKLADTDADGNVTVYFDSTEQADSYTVRIGTGPGIYSREEQVASSPCVIKDLPAGKYYVAVTCTKDGLESGIYNEKEITVR